MSRPTITTEQSQSLETAILGFPRPAADTLWAFSSPDLFSGELGEYKNFCEHYSELINYVLDGDIPHDTDGCSVSTPSATPRQPLGIFFEQRIADFISLPAFPLSIALRNFQINDAGKTKGELDFVLSDKRGNLIHLEAAIKFYLLRQEYLEPHRWKHWIGPNSVDRLDKKLHRMLTHQLPLGKASINKLPSPSNNQSTTSFASMYFLKGVFFYHWQQERLLPAHANPAAHSGVWLYRKEWLDLLRSSNSKWLALNKHQWLIASLPGYLRRYERLIAATTLHDQVRQCCEEYFPRLFLEVVTQGASPQERLVMVVNDYWPETKSPSLMR